MDGYYDPLLVAISLMVAILASYTALDLTGRLAGAKGRVFGLWLFGGAIAMGTGIWSMHFIGMLAFHLPIAIDYDLPLTLLSLLLAILVSALALPVMAHPTLTLRIVSGSAVLMGLGISAMHYVGMASMRMSPGISYDPLLVAASMGIAIVASGSAFWIAFRLSHEHSLRAILSRLGSAAVMGLAITGMHYTGMAAAAFPPGSVCLTAGGVGGLASVTLAVFLGPVSLMILALTLATSALDAHSAATQAKVADSLRSTNEELSDIALYDALTGLPNRLLLEDRLGQAARRSTRSGRGFCLAFIDLDGFKAVNDSFGHAVGDALLKEVARRLRDCIRAEDTAARVGGDEFQLLLNDADREEDIARKCVSVLERLARPLRVEGHDLVISASIGVAIFPRDGKDPRSLAAHADAAMYQAKRSGGQRCSFGAPEERAGP